MIKKTRRKFVAVDPDTCVGCGVCEYVCSLEKEKTFNPVKSRIRAVRLSPTSNLAVTCMLCEDAPCVIACPRLALEQSEKSGVILVDEEKCDGCGLCIDACDYGAIMLHPERKVVLICDLCEGDPKCVEWCPEEALDLTSWVKEARLESTKKLFREAIKQS